MTPYYLFEGTITLRFIFREADFICALQRTKPLLQRLFVAPFTACQNLFFLQKEQLCQMGDTSALFLLPGWTKLRLAPHREQPEPAKPVLHPQKPDLCGKKGDRPILHGFFLYSLSLHRAYVWFGVQSCSVL